MRVKNFLKTLVNINNRIFYLPSGGNAGDALINIGFFQLAEQIGLEYKVLNHSDIKLLKSSDYVIVSGGGCLVPEWHSTPKAVSEIIKITSNLVILPHSIRGIDDLMRELPSTAVIFCREEFSYDYCYKKRPDISIHLDDDMAFFCNVSKILNYEGKLTKINAKNTIRITAFYYHKFQSKIKTELNAFRCDKEANSSLNVKRNNINDISTIAAYYGSTDYHGSMYSGKKFLQIINMYDTINTDRLHISVAGYLLKKNVNIYNNSYFKCLGVYQQSMKKDPNIKFVK